MFDITVNRHVGNELADKGFEAIAKFAKELADSSECSRADVGGLSEADNAG